MRPATKSLAFAALLAPALACVSGAPEAGAPAASLADRARVARALAGAPAASAGVARAAASDELRLDAAGVSIGIRRLGASPVRAESLGGVAVFRGALAGADVAEAPIDGGVEDFVFFERAPRREILEYDLDVSRAAGLRLVGGRLEVLDASGAPRLRAEAPYVVDAAGTRHAARLAVSGCRVDASPAPPWDRPVTPPGAKTCRMSVAWSGVEYPAVVDPAWGATTSPAARYGHAQIGLGGKVLVAFGFYRPDGGMGTGYVHALELFDPATRTWASVGNIPVDREDLAIAPLPSGKVIMLGGGGSSRADLYGVAAGVGRSNASSSRASGLTATALASGKVLVAGGVDGAPVATAQLYDEAVDDYTPAGAGGVMGAARGYHTATRLASGKVLIAGGRGPGGSLASAELYDPATNTFAPTGAMAAARSEHVAALLGDGRVLVAGGDSATAEIYDPATGKFGAAGSLSSARSSAQAVVLASGHVMVAGGSEGGTEVGDVEIFDPGTTTFAPQPSLSFARAKFGLSRLSTDEVLAAGGIDPKSFSVRVAELWRPLAKGVTCKDKDDCASGVCQEGVCCAGPCAGACKTCLPSTGACVAVTSSDDPDSCTGASTCDPAGACRKKNGQKCAAAADCASGQCVDGFCCERACGGQCEACDVAGHEGKCIPVAGEAHGTRPRCAATGEKCGGTCNGASVECAYPSADTTCGQTCDVKLTTVSVCDGRGACVAGAPQSCPGNFVCADKASCKTSCASDADCLDGYACKGGICNAIPLCNGHVITKGKEKIDCAPYACDPTGVCRTSCGSVADCAEPSLCSADGRCVPPPEPLEASCRAAPGRSPPAGAALVVLVAAASALVARRRR